MARHFLNTRPREDAEPLTALLAARGHAVTPAPLLTIDYVTPADLDLGGVAGLLATSANGVRAFARACAERELALYAVGDATAMAAREAALGAAQDERKMRDMARAALDAWQETRDAEAAQAQETVDARPRIAARNDAAEVLGVEQSDIAALAREAQEARQSRAGARADRAAPRRRPRPFNSSLDRDRHDSGTNPRFCYELTNSIMCSRAEPSSVARGFGAGPSGETWPFRDQT